MTVVDHITERAARWLAARTTRRSFLANTARIALVGAGGVGLAAVFSDQASARVCGQSGTSPMCPTYDCAGPDVSWGYCWYASPGCCSNGGLKKICDCCGVGYKNVQGYCAPGSAVYCVVESCLEDPRVQRVVLDRYVAATVVDANLAYLLQRPDGSSPSVVITTNDPLFMAIAAPVAAELGAALAVCDGPNLRPATLTQLRRIGVARFTVVGRLSGDAIAALSAIAPVDQLSQSDDIAVESVEIAQWLFKRNGHSEVVAIGAGDAANRIAGAAGAYAAVRRRALLISADAVGAFQTATSTTGAALLVGAEVSTAASKYANAVAINSDDIELVATTIANRMLRSTDSKLTARFASVDEPTLLGAIPAVGPVVLIRGGDDRTALRDWIIEHANRFNDAMLVRSGNGPADDGLVYALQSALNGFDSHFLTGHDGDGIPVYAQPIEEQAFGAVRLRGELPITTATTAPKKKKVSSTTAPVGVAPPATPAPRGAEGPSTTTTLFVQKSSRPSIATRANRGPSVPTTTLAPDATTTTVIAKSEPLLKPSDA